MVKVPNAEKIEAYPHGKEQLTYFPVYYVDDEVATGAAGLSDSVV